MWTKFSVSTPASGVARTAQPGIEFRQFLFDNESDILTHGTFRHAVNSHPLSLQLHEGSHADTANCDRIHLTPSKGFQWLAHPVGVVQIVVGDFFYRLGLCVNDHKTRSEPKCS